MASVCITKTLMSEFIRETGRDFYEWQRLLLSAVFENEEQAMQFLMMHGLSKQKAILLLEISAAQIQYK